MGIYAKDVEDKIKSINYKENILFNYDNYTYNIKLFMIPKQQYKLYTEIYSENIPEIEKYLKAKKLLDKNKIIIYESGVTPNMTIDSLKMKTYTPCSEKSIYGTTVSFDLTLSEVNGSIFINKMAFASYLCGWEAYTNQPYFIEISFKGYDAKSGSAVEKINVSKNTDEIYQFSFIYSCIATMQSSITEGGKTQYKMYLYSGSYENYIKEINCINGIKTDSNTEQQIDENKVCGNIMKTYEEYIEDIIKQLNDNILKSYGKNVEETVYKNNKTKPIVVEIDEALKSDKTDIAKEYNKDYLKKILKEYRDKNGNATGNDFMINRIDRYSKTHPTGGDLLYTLYGMSGGFIIDAISAINYRYNINQVHKEIKNNGLKFDLTPNPYDTIQSYLEKISIIYHYKLYEEGFKLIFEQNPVFIQEYKGKKYYTHKILIKRKEVPGLKDMIHYLLNDDPYQYNDNIKQEQLDYLKIVENSNLIFKKYNWLNTGENTNVLSVKHNDDNMWYLNTGISTIYKINKNEESHYFVVEENEIVDDKKIDKTVEESESAIKDYLKNKNDIYIDDAYEIFLNKKTNSFKEIKNLFNIIISDDINQASKPFVSFNVIGTSGNEKRAKELEENIYKTRIGIDNIFQYTSKKINLSMDILGDPYWLMPGSNLDLTKNLYIEYLPHITLTSNTFYNLDKNDNYKRDKYMDLTTVYMITEVLSTFENGKFTQTLNGFVATPFIQSSAWVDEEGYTYSNNSLTVNSNIGETTIEDESTGEVIHENEKNMQLWEMTHPIGIPFIGTGVKKDKNGRYII